ncbi:methyltransferase [Streptomyces sp. JV184]|uniref:methyltransferase n=1 Tax=Streptomyces sp. JV184 TaxID=858637 RepID=UPI002E7A5BAF|nr:methyltransferase [Streptomyces sp. JV184]MEE1743395.1 methyltransferase [Streptomyces sp. JV184]
MTLFASVAADYARYRPGIPDEAVRLLGETLDGCDRPTPLDLGSGTGQVPAALLPAVLRIARVDQDSGMVRFAAGPIRPLDGQTAVVFHAVPAETFTLGMADRVTSPTATVAVMGDGSLWTHEARWTGALKALLQSYLGDGRRAGTSGAYAEPSSRYEDDLAESAFGKVTEHRFPVHRAWTPDQVVGYLRSTSFARPALFHEPGTPPGQAGCRHARFEREARVLREEYVHGEGLVEDAVFTVLLARRGGAV